MPERRLLTCKDCGHRWFMVSALLASGHKKPEQCPNPNCRSRRWERGSAAPRFRMRPDLNVAPLPSALEKQASS